MESFETTQKEILDLLKTRFPPPPPPGSDLMHMELDLFSYCYIFLEFLIFLYFLFAMTLLVFYCNTWHLLLCYENFSC